MGEISSALFKCEVCERQLSNSYNLRRHMLILHGISEMSENIPFNSKSIPFNSKIVPLETTTSIEDDDKSYKCSRCGNSFVRKWNLMRHEKKCRGYNPIKCDYCDKFFSYYSAKYRHQKTCRKKIEVDAKSVTIKNHCQEANTINNNTHIENQNNQTQNIILVYKPENMEFIKDHIGESALEYIKSIYPTIDHRIVTDYSKRIMDLPENRCIKKTDLKSGYSDVHIGDNKWEKISDQSVYPHLACSVANNLSEYVNVKRSKLQKETFDKIMKFIDYMADEGYINTEDKVKEKRILKQFKAFVKDLKLIVFNKSSLNPKSYESQNDTLE